MQIFSKTTSEQKKVLFQHELTFIPQLFGKVYHGVNKKLEKVVIGRFSEIQFIPTFPFLQYSHIFTLREKCPDTEVFLVRIFPHSDRIRRDPEISPHSARLRENTDQKNLRIWIGHFSQCHLEIFFSKPSQHLFVQS